MAPLDRQRDGETNPERARGLEAAAFELPPGKDRGWYREHDQDELPDHADTMTSVPGADDVVAQEAARSLLDLFNWAIPTRAAIHPSPKIRQATQWHLCDAPLSTSKAASLQRYSPPMLPLGS